MIKAHQLTKKYGDILALDRLDLQIAPGETFCLLGQNGAGKTTTLHCFLGFLTPDGGQAMVHGIPVAKKPLEARRHMAYLPEVVTLYPQLSALENLDYFSRLAGFRHDKSTLEDYLRRTGLSDQSFRRRTEGFSKGMRQKVGIAIALAKQADALFLDEPTSGLDPKAAVELSGLLNELRAEGCAILMATHDIFRAIEVATHIGIMKEGRLVDVITNDTGREARALEALYLQTI